VRNAYSVCGRLVVGGLTRISAKDRLLDNLSFDENGALWAAGIPKTSHFLSAYYDLEKVAPSSAFRITKNVGKKAFFGEKLKVEKV
jgi:arylesterase / paraoxonase